MKLPICYFCARTKVLCPRDQERLERGEISELDVALSHELVMLKESKFPKLDKLEFLRAVKVDDYLFLVVRGLDSLGPQVVAQVARELSRRGYGRVRLVEEVHDIRRFVSQVLYPTRVMGVDITWFPDGSSEYSVRIPKSDLKKMPYPKRDAEKILETMLGRRVRIVSVPR